MLLSLKVYFSIQISQRVMEKMRNKSTSDSLVSVCGYKSEQDTLNQLQEDDYHNNISACLDRANDGAKSEPFELYKRRTTVVVRRKTFLDVICDALTEYKYVGPNQRADLTLACR